MKSPYIIAEAGSCHEGQITRALQLIHTASFAGADAVKFQFWSSPQRMRERRKMDVPDAYTWGSVCPQWLPVLHETAKSVQLDFLCTAYLPEDVAVVEPYVDMFKVSSFESNDRELLQAHAGYDKVVIMSMGMGAQWDGQLVGPKVRFLHCVSGYPTPVDQAGLRGGFEDGDGYSDHTRNVLTGAVAVGAGAQMLEVHFRLEDTNPQCPDYVVALSPPELNQYVDNARLAGRMMSSTKRVQECERINVRHRVGV